MARSSSLKVPLPGVELLFKLVEAYEQVGLKAFWGASLKRLQEADKLQKSGARKSRQLRVLLSGWFVLCCRASEALVEAAGDGRSQFGLHR